MHIRHTAITSIVALLTFSLSATMAIPQTKPNATSPPKKSSTVAAKTIPTIKCTDADSMTACKSFKQIVDARDKGLANSLTGDKDSRERHFAYVCLRPKEDNFKIVEFDEPLAPEYRPYSPPGEADDISVLSNGQSAFSFTKDKPILQLIDAQKKWFNDHDDFFIYQFGWIYVESWENGILTDYVSDYGKWRRPLPQRNSRLNESATFESAHQWLAHFNKANEDKLLEIDDKERPRIIVDDTNIYVHYSYKNKNNDYTDYTLTIQRSTGRFTESFVAPGIDPFDNSGTCMSFKY
jgi:hypothetical protein